MREFLAPAQAPLRERYRNALNDYYGAGTLNEERFETVLSKLRDLDQQIPGFGERLWESNGLGEKFTVSNFSLSHGRELNSHDWTARFNDWKAELLLKAGDYYLLEPEERLQTLSDFAQSVTKRIAEHEQKLASSSLNRRAIAKIEQEFYRTLKESSAYQSASAYVLHRYLNSEAVRDQMLSGNADLILSSLKILDQKTELLLEDPAVAEIPRGWLSLVKSQIPKVSALLEDYSLFPQTQRKTNRNKLVPASKSGLVDYHFIPFPRRFHGIWKGFPIGECVSADCRRFATVAIADTQLYSVESDGKSRGFIQIVPGRIGEKIYGSIDFGSAVLANKIVSAPGEPLSPYKNIYERVLSEIGNRLPSHWDGLVVGKDKAINNAGMLPIVHASPHYLAGQEVALGKNFSLMDPMAEKIARSQAEGVYGAGMIFDGAVSGNKEHQLVKLSLRPDSVPTKQSLVSTNLRIAELSRQEAFSAMFRDVPLEKFLTRATSLPISKKVAYLAEASLNKLYDYQIEMADSGLRVKSGLNAAEFETFSRALSIASVEKSIEYLNHNRLGWRTLPSDPGVLVLPTWLTVVGTGFYGVSSGLELFMPRGHRFLSNHPEILAYGLGVVWGSAIFFEIYENWKNTLQAADNARDYLADGLAFARKQNIKLPPSLLRAASRRHAGKKCRELARELAKNPPIP